MFCKKIVLFLLLTVACVSLSCAELSYDFTLQDLEDRPISLSDYRGKVVFLDFWATWCGPCRMVAPIIEELANKYDGKIVVGKCDVEDNEELAAEFGIRNIPTILFFKNGEVVDKIIGAQSKSKFEEKFEALL